MEDTSRKNYAWIGTRKVYQSEGQIQNLKPASFERHQNVKVEREREGGINLLHSFSKMTLTKIMLSPQTQKIRKIQVIKSFPIG